MGVAKIEEGRLINYRGIEHADRAKTCDGNHGTPSGENTGVEEVRTSLGKASRNLRH